jgi:hypothetical protein
MYLPSSCKQTLKTQPVNALAVAAIAYAWATTRNLKWIEYSGDSYDKAD